jgi:chorismate synthase
MSNTFGRLLRVTNFGESHGVMIGCVIDGCPPGFALSESDIQPDLDRRKPGTSRHVTQRQEADQVQIVSGVFEGKTTGTPIALLIPNTDERSSDYNNLAETFRPGHADYTYFKKYGLRDHRGGGRSSARLTAPMVAAGAVAKKWLEQQFNIQIKACLDALHDIEIPFESWDFVHQNPFFSPNQSIVPQLERWMDMLRKSGDSCGARLMLQAFNVPAGWGAPLFAKLDGDIASAMMSINAVKGVEIGAGFSAVQQRGSEHGDDLYPALTSNESAPQRQTNDSFTPFFKTNHAGGVLGGISSGQSLSIKVAVKPTSSIRLTKQSLDHQGNPIDVSTQGRHDPCVGLRAAPILEAMLALVLMDHALLHHAQCEW